ncbi:PAS domain S-box protein [candidate division KSB1 bacterium]|nr:PAS domain S-box protein [candidate division KSB1 bacterium]
MSLKKSKQEKVKHRDAAEYNFILVRKLRCLPFARCQYCDLSFQQCFCGFKTPMLLVAIMLLILIIWSGYHPVITALSMGLALTILLIFIVTGNQESSKLIVENLNLKLAEAAMRISELKYHSLYSSLPGGSFAVDYTYRIKDVNEFLCNLTSYSREELIGQQCDIICPKGPHKCPIFDLNKEHIDNDETSVKHKDGRLIPIIKSARRITIEDMDYIVENFQDITALKQAEEKLKASLQEKSVLLQEVHHRVKNNLQVISSLVYLQSKQVNDQHILPMFQETQNRVRAMAMIHENLYKSSNLARIDFAVYLEKLIKQLFRSYDVRTDAVELQIEVDKVELSIDTAIICGMIINELVSNSLKYAFPENRNGSINIRIFKAINNLVTMIISDDGIGFPERVDFPEAKSLDLQLVDMLVKQIEGKIQLARNHGACFTIQFKENQD